MSDNKHTPGPWRAAVDTLDIFDQKGFTIIECHYYGHRDPARELADRILISAAPDMLAMLLRVRNHGGIEKLSQFDEIDSLIAKATGQGESE
jgi:hypothetical protein